MIPNIFISSTIADLNYLRDGLREAILELKYHPVMSEHGEVGYLQATTAADSCYKSVEQCQIVILIVGKRYGSVTEAGLSVTHREYLAAREAGIPTITFVEPQVLHYMEVFKFKPDAELWHDFPQMDNPTRTFALLDEISQSDSFNAIIPFDSAGQAKDKLKLQLADFVGNRLGETIAPMSNQLKDVLAEIKTIRNQLAHTSTSDVNTKMYLAATRYLLNDNVADYRALLEKVFGNFDAAIEKICTLESLNSVLESAGFTHEILPDEELTMAVGHEELQARRSKRDPKYGAGIYGHFGIGGGYMIYAKNHLQISKSYAQRFSDQQHKLYVKAKLT